MLTKKDYVSLIGFESIDEILSYLSNNSDYKNAISQYYTRTTPVFSFIKALHFYNNNRWLSLTRNIESSLNIEIEKIQQVIDIKNTLLIFNLMPNFQNDQNIDLESFFTNLSFGGTISYYNWVELSKDFSIHNFLGKTVLLAPPIHKFFNKLQNNFEVSNLNMNAIKEITDISFNNEDTITNNLTLNLLGFDMNLYILRFLSRYTKNITDDNKFQRLKDIMIPWNNIKTFIGKGLFDVEKFDPEIVKTIMERILIQCKNFNLELPPNRNQKEGLTKYDYFTSEILIAKLKSSFLKKESFKENQLGKLLYILTLLIQEIENLSMILFGKLHGLPNEDITDKINVFSDEV